MKKIWLLFVLCATLLFAACGESTNEPTPTPAPTATLTPTPTPTPANAAKEALDNLQNACNSLLGWKGTAANEIDISKGFGYDITMDVRINQLLLSLLDMQDLNNLGINLALDMNNDLMAADMHFNLNEDELFDFKMFYDYKKLLYNIPKYSSQYAGIEAAAETEAEAPFTAADTEELLTLYQTVLSDLFGAFQPQEEFVDNATIEAGDYKVTGQKFTVIASVEDLNNILNNFASTFQTIYPEAEIEVTELPADKMNSLIFHAYVGENGTFAWEIYPDTSADTPVGLIAAEHGFCIFSTKDGVKEFVVRSEKNSATEGILYIPNEEAEFLLSYTLDNNYISVSDEEGSFSFSLDWNISDTYVSTKLSLMLEGYGINYSLVADGTKSHADMSIIGYDTELVNVSADMTIRDFNEVTMPETYVDEETWEAQADMDALVADMTALLEKYPALATLFGGEEDPGTGSEEIYDTPGSDPTVTYENEFMNMTGYYADENGDVYFEALPEEVLAIGQPSTGIFYTEITPETKQALIHYATTAFPSGYMESGTFYQVSGNEISDTVASYYYEEYYCMDTTNQYNVIDLYFEAVTGNFYSVDVYNASKEEAFRMANELLAVLGESATLDISLNDADLTEGVWVGDFLIYGSNYGTYYCINIY